MLSAGAARGYEHEVCEVTESTNLRVLKPSRARPRVGDVFVARPLSEEFLFGRVVSTEARIGPMDNCILVYLFDIRSPNKQPPLRAALTPTSLLTAPVMTNRLPWTHGYFETVDNWELQPDDLLARHCFRRSNGQYFDETNRELAGPIEPVGDWALHSYRTIDDLISDALGIPRAPD
jgi:hypothetical protein